MMDGDYETLLENKLKEHGFQPSKKKPGLFYKEHSVNAMLYADCRQRETPKFYGFLNKTEPMPNEVVNELTQHLRQELSALGMAPLASFDEEKGDEVDVEAVIHAPIEIDLSRPTVVTRKGKVVGEVISLRQADDKDLTKGLIGKLKITDKSLITDIKNAQNMPTVSIDFGDDEEE